MFLGDEMGEKRTKKQHYVPQVHLRYFVGNDPADMIWTYDTESGRVSPSLPKETAAESNYYSVQNDAGEYNDLIETWLADVEAKAKAPYEELLSGRIPQEQARADFSVFLASMYSRTPAMRRIYAEIQSAGMQLFTRAHMSNEEFFNQSLVDFEKEHGPIDSEVKPKLRDFFMDKDNYEVQIDRQATIPALELSDKISEMLFDMGWCIFDAGDEYFITSDNPVTRIVPKEHTYGIYGDGGFVNRHVIVSFPLSPSKCLMMGWGDDIQETIRLPREHVRAYNRQRAYFAERYLFAHFRCDGIRRLGEKHKHHKLGITFGSEGQFAKTSVVRKLS